MSVEQQLAKVEDVADKTFDFVIIGGGLAGCVLAARLSENPEVSVAVLEAGKSHINDPLVSIPDGWMRQAFNPEYDWLFRTKPQSRVQNGITTPDAKPDPSFYWSRGKGLGGSTNINFLLWTRPSREEVDNVEKLGNPGWNWERFFAAAKRCETFVETPVSNDPKYRDPVHADYGGKYVGHAGPVTISFAEKGKPHELYVGHQGPVTISFAEKGKTHELYVGHQGPVTISFAEKGKPDELYVGHQGPVTISFAEKGKPNELYVGHQGPVTISFSRTVSGAESAMQQALAAYGIPVIDDALGGNLSGTFKCPNNIDTRTGTRSTAATSYLYPALARPNLNVLTDAYVTRILTSKEEDQAVAKAVEFKHRGRTYAVNVGREAILSSSTVKSPHILELSGIGNYEILERLGIPVVVDLPGVGENLQDHLILANPTWALKPEKGIVTSDTIGQPEIVEKLKALYGDHNGGPLYFALSGCTFVPIQTFSDRADELIAAFEKKLLEKADRLPVGLKEQYELQLKMLKDKNVPDIEIIVFPINMQPGSFDTPFVGLLPSIGHPHSRGSIHAVSKDPEVQPEIDPNYIEEDLDLELLVDALKFVRKVASEDAWKAITSGELLPGPDVATDDQIRENVKQNVSTTWHACGTCSMMPREKGGVVDPHLKVYGTKNIRVADLSMWALLPAVHTQVLVYGIAEIAADVIKADNGI